MHDTLKKPSQLLAVAYAVRFPELAAKSKHPGGELDLDTMDPQVCDRLGIGPSSMYSKVHAGG